MYIFSKFDEQMVIMFKTSNISIFKGNVSF